MVRISSGIAPLGYDQAHLEAAVPLSRMRLLQRRLRSTAPWLRRIRACPGCLFDPCHEELAAAVKQHAVRNPAHCPTTTLPAQPLPLLPCLSQLVGLCAGTACVSSWY